MTKQFFLLRTLQYEDLRSIGGNVGYQELFPTEAACFEKEESRKTIEMPGDELKKVELIRFDLDDTGRPAAIAVKTFFDQWRTKNPEWVSVGEWSPEGSQHDNGPIAGDEEYFSDPMIKLDFDNPIVEITVGQPLRYQLKQAA